MTNLITSNNDYANWVASLKQRYRSAQIKASVKVNTEVLRFYWELGRDMVNLDIEKRWGEGVMKTLSQDLKEALPTANGFSLSNLYYIKNLYSTYSQAFEKFPQLGGKLDSAEQTAFLPQLWANFADSADLFFSLPWSHHKYILDKIKGDVPPLISNLIQQTHNS